MDNFSLLRSANVRPMWQALAHLMANTRATDPKWDSYSRIFNQLPPAEKLRCQHELLNCRLAKRGEVEAVVS